MRHAYGLLLLVAAIPGAHACSLAYQPFADATFHDDGLWYVDGSSLRHVEGATEVPVADAFFITYARLPDDRLLLAGQDGLSPACNGLDWLELRDGPDVVWRKEVSAQVFDAPGGPYVAISPPQRDDDGDRAREPMQLWRLVGDDLVRIGEGRDDVLWVFGMTAAGLPIAYAEGGAYIGDRFLPVSGGYVVDTAATSGATAVVERDTDRLRLHVLAGGTLITTQWAKAEGWGDDVAAVDGGWLVVTGGRAYLVRGTVIDLGVEEAMAAASKAGKPVVFVEEGYLAFDGFQATESWRREDGAWHPAPVPTLKPVEVEATRETSEPVVVPRPPSPEGDRTLDIPSPGLALLLVAVGSVLAGRRR